MTTVSVAGELAKDAAPACAIGQHPVARIPTPAVALVIRKSLVSLRVIKITARQKRARPQILIYFVRKPASSH